MVYTVFAHDSRTKDLYKDENKETIHPPTAYITKVSGGRVEKKVIQIIVVQMIRMTKMMKYQASQEKFNTKVAKAKDTFPKVH